MSADQIGANRAYRVDKADKSRFSLYWVRRRKDRISPVIILRAHPPADVTHLRFDVVEVSMAMVIEDPDPFSMMTKGGDYDALSRLFDDLTCTPTHTSRTIRLLDP